MSTHIEWTEQTWNPVLGCSKVSEGCRNCYAMAEAWRKRGHPHPRVRAAYDGLTEIRNHRPQWTGVFRELPERLGEPLRWKQARRVFVNSMSDLFGEGVSDGFIAAVWDVMGRAPQHTYQILTKRPERMRDWVTRWAHTGEPAALRLVRGPEATRTAHPSGRGQLFAAMLEQQGDPPPGYTWPTFDWMEGQKWWPRVLPHVWLGVSVEDQPAADTRIPLLLQTPAAVRFISAEPLLGPIDLCSLIADPDGACRLHWCITGAESGPGARRMDPDWVRSLRDACLESNAAFFLKQDAVNGRKIPTPELDGRRWMEYPA